MVDELSKKKRLIEEITRCLEEISFWRNNYVFEDELDFTQVCKLDNLIGKAWLEYYKIYSSKR